MSRKQKLLILATFGVALLFAAEASAQQKQKYFFKTPPGASKYTQQHTIEVGDVPGHVLRLVEFHDTFTGDAPVYDEVKVAEAWVRLISDLTDRSGHVSGYIVNLMANGDKIFARVEILTQATPDSRATYMQVITLTGGTGRFVGLRGTLRSSGWNDFKNGASDTQTEGEYWIEK